MRLLALIGLFSSCYTVNHDTRFKIVSFRVVHYDTTDHTIDIQFDVKYHLSDKDTGYLSLEKGLKGSDDKVLYFGFTNQSESYLKGCGHLSFQEFTEGFNNKRRAFIGQRFDGPYTFCMAPQYKKENNEIILVLENQDTKKVDTLTSVIAPSASL